MNRANLSNQNVTKSAAQNAVGRSDIVSFSTSLTPERREVVSSFTIELLDSVARKTGNDKIVITSSIRSSQVQARAMYDNLARDYNIAYRLPGRQVVAVYRDCKAQGLSKEETLSRMVTKIEELSREGNRVSLHCVAASVYAGLNVIDISYVNGSATNAKDFIIELSKEPAVKQIIHPFPDITGCTNARIDLNEPAIHVEIQVGN